MRIHFKINTSDKILPFDHQPLLTGAIHKWMGWNDEHGNVSLYSFSQLEGGRVVSTGFQFSVNTYFFFSSFDPQLIKKIVSGVRADPEMFYGLTVSEVVIQEDPDLSDRTMFLAASPIFLKRRVGEKVDHVLYDDPRSGECLKETLMSKMSKAGMTDDSLRIRFDPVNQKACTKKITYNKVQNRASWCSVIIEGKPETKLFAWNVGLGNSTGIGFGAIK